MRVTTVTATIKYSQDTGKGAWKAVEIGAEGTLDAKEHWQQAQAFLYAELSQQLKSLWANANGSKAHSDSESHGEPIEAPEPPAVPVQPPEHYCQEHQKEFKR